MQKFEIRVYQERAAYFCIEAHDAKEAKQLFISKMQNDDDFVDKIGEVLLDGIIDEGITATPTKYGGAPDYTYEQMKECDK